MFRSYIRKIVLQLSGKELAPIDYWQKRAKSYGKKAVWNIAHSYLARYGEVMLLYTREVKQRI